MYGALDAERYGRGQRQQQQEPNRRAAARAACVEDATEVADAGRELRIDRNHFPEAAHQSRRVDRRFGFGGGVGLGALLAQLLDHFAADRRDELVVVRLGHALGQRGRGFRAGRGSRADGQAGGQRDGEKQTDGETHGVLRGRLGRF